MRDGVFDQDATASDTAARPAPGPAVVSALRSLQQAVDAVPTLVGTGEGVGSNAWVVDGEHSTTGMPLLANDPHLAPTLPGVWYQMGLHCTDADRRRAPSTSPASPSPACPGWSSGTTSRSPGGSPTSGPTSPTSTSRQSTASATCATATPGRGSTAAPRRSRSPVGGPSPSRCAPPCTARCSPTSTRRSPRSGRTLRSRPPTAWRNAAPGTPSRWRGPR